MTAPAPQCQPSTNDLSTTPWMAGGVTKDRFVTSNDDREGIFSLGDVNIFPNSGPGPVAIAAGAEIAAQIVTAVNSHASLKARNEELEAALRDARGDLTGLAADCHRSKWEFDLSEDFTPTAKAARALILTAFRQLHRIGDRAIKASKAAQPSDEARGPSEL